MEDFNSEKFKKNKKRYIEYKFQKFLSETEGSIVGDEKITEEDIADVIMPKIQNFKTFKNNKFMNFDEMSKYGLIYKANQVLHKEGLALSRFDGGYSFGCLLSEDSEREWEYSQESIDLNELKYKEFSENRELIFRKKLAQVVLDPVMNQKFFKQETYKILKETQHSYDRERDIFITKLLQGKVFTNTEYFACAIMLMPDFPDYGVLIFFDDKTPSISIKKLDKLLDPSFFDDSTKLFIEMEIVDQSLLEYLKI